MREWWLETLVKHVHCRACRDNLTKVLCSSNFHWPRAFRFIFATTLARHEWRARFASALASDLGHRIIWKANFRLGLHRWQELNALHLVYREIRYLLTFPSPWDNLRKWNFNAEHLIATLIIKTKNHFTSGNIFFFEVNFKNVKMWCWRSTSITRVLVSALIYAALARSFLSLVKSLSLLFTVGILKN